MASKLKSSSMRNLTVTENLSVGEGAVAYSSFKLNFRMLSTTFGSARRERYSALYETDPKKTWMVPNGLMVKGLTIEPLPVLEDPNNKNGHIECLKDLPNKILPESSDSSDVALPSIGEVAFVVHRTKDDDASGNCYPTGKYMTGEPDEDEVGFQPGAGETYSQNNVAYYDSFKYFKNFIVNLEGGCQESQIPIGTLDPWNTTYYRRAIPAKRYTLQPGSPLTYVDASRTLFRHLPDEVGVPACSVYIDMSKNALVSDGTWGIALGLVGQSTFDQTKTDAGGTDWPQLKLSVIVHTEQIRS